MNWSRTQKLWLGRVIGILISMLITMSLYKEFNSRLNKDFITVASDKIISAFFDGRVLFILVLVLMNWGIEAIKWKLLVKPLEQITWWRSFKSVLTGISISIITPNRMGEYAGRIWYLRQENRLLGVTANIVGSIAQFIVAGSFGIIGMIYYHFNYRDLWFLPLTILVSIFVIVALIIGYFELSTIVNRISQARVLKPVVRYLRVANAYPTKLKLRMIYLSAIRYIIFAVQYWLILTLFQGGLAFLPTLASVFSIYWTMAIIPSLALTELPLRAQTGIWYLSHLITNIENIAIASVLLWLINLILPAVAGLFVLLGEKVFSKE